MDTALFDLKDDQKTKDQTILELGQEVRECNFKQKRADNLLRRLNSEKHKWIVCVRMLQQKQNALGGDLLTAAGYITLLTGFTQKFRQSCLKKWTKVLYDQGFESNREFAISDLFCNNSLIRKWHQNDLPADPMSVSNATVLLKTI